jgi:predicted HicB family RNase H-like nuclease
VETRLISLSVALSMCNDRLMTDYRRPQLQGKKVALMARVSPAQHRAAIEASHEAGLSMAEYIGALIDRDAGRPNKLDNKEEEQQLPLANSA